MCLCPSPSLLRASSLTFARSLLDCQHLHAAHPGLLHGRRGPGTPGEAAMTHTHTLTKAFPSMDLQAAARK